MDWRQRYLARYYNRNTGWVDGTVEFHALCASVCAQANQILEIGAGPPNQTTEFLAGLAKVHGLDPDPAVLTNQYLSEATVLTGDHFPFGDGVFDCCVSNYVVEHLPDPSTHLREVHRVLRPGGAYVFRTSNRWHYVGLVASLTPHWFHELVANRLRNLPPEAHAPYPTSYALNTRRAVSRHAARAGFHVEVLRLVEKEPSYGMYARPLFLLFTAYERIVNATARLANFRAMIYAVLRRQ
jgi:SAM-dependent methyltransferase